MADEKYELHTEYRPRDFDEFIGNEKIVTGILAVIDRTHTYILYGMRGCGKTTLARLIAKRIGTDPMEVHEINAASKTGIDDVRPILAAADFTPMVGKSKVFIIDEFHRLSPNAIDAFLKVTEEPPKHCYFIFCTTDIDNKSIKATLKSRSKMFEVGPLDPEDSGRLIDWICQEEGIRLSPAVRHAIIHREVIGVKGIPREMIVLLDMIRDIKEEKAQLEMIESTYGDVQIRELCQALLQKAKWAEVAKVLKGITDEPENVRYAVLGYMSAVLLNKDNRQAAIVIGWFLDSFMYSKRGGLTLACYNAVRD